MVHDKFSAPRLEFFLTPNDIIYNKSYIFFNKTLTTQCPLVTPVITPRIPGTKY